MTTSNGPELIAADTVVIAAGQDSARGLAQALDRIGWEAGREVGREAGRETGRGYHLIGGAAEAAELDAKRAIDQGTRLAARL